MDVEPSRGGPVGRGSRSGDSPPPSGREFGGKQEGRVGRGAAGEEAGGRRSPTPADGCDGAAAATTFAGGVGTGRSSGSGVGSGGRRRGGASGRRRQGSGRAVWGSGASATATPSFRSTGRWSASEGGVEGEQAAAGVGGAGGQSGAPGPARWRRPPSGARGDGPHRSRRRPRSRIRPRLTPPLARGGAPKVRAPF
ncbi:hypothetical protein SETIT_7G086900v2 [Setaria italica]|uniref:Uncharacterized protein n=1 Tax=Setaria italica TaxID=4555 RepID=A0A368RTJ3_SETIT|nr:hypothetical protein SETIT_7G086900v2 [Setaria italica]